MVTSRSSVWLVAVASAVAMTAGFFIAKHTDRGDERQAVAAPAIAAERQPQPPVEPEAAFAKAKALVEGAVARGTWTANNRVELRVLFPHLAPEQREEVVAVLFPAANRGALRVQVAGPLL